MTIASVFTPEPAFGLACADEHTVHFIRHLAGSGGRFIFLLLLLFLGADAKEDEMQKEVEAACFRSSAHLLVIAASGR